MINELPKLKNIEDLNFIIEEFKKLIEEVRQEELEKINKDKNIVIKNAK